MKDGPSQTRSLAPSKQGPLLVILRYGLAILAVAAGWLLRTAMTAWIGPGLPTFITFYPAVIVVALLSGPGPGLLTTALVIAVVGYWIMPPIGQFFVASAVDRASLVLFFNMGLFISAVAELYRRNRVKAAAYDREQALRETTREKEFLADLLEHAAQPFAVGYPDGSIGGFNRAYEELTGYTAAELRSLDWSATLTPPEWREIEEQQLNKLHRTGKPVRYEKEYIRKDGTRVPIELFVHLVRDGEGKPEYYYSFIMDITDRKSAEKTLRESEDRFRLALQHAPVSVAAQDRDLRYFWAYNQRTARPDEIIGKTDADIFTSEEAARLGVLKRRVLEEDIELREQMWLNRPGGLIFLDIFWEPIHDGAGSVIGIGSATIDLTNLKLAEEALKQSASELQAANTELRASRSAALNLMEDADMARKKAEDTAAALRESEERIRSSLIEKEVLLKEIHHRVKNNMQVISSLVALQAAELEDVPMRGALDDVSYRVRSMALVHEKLYQSTDLARIDFAEYIGSLLGYLWRAHGTAVGAVRLTLDLEPVSLSVDIAVPCGLILNELASNALKHAFRGRATGEVTVSLRGITDGRVSLRISDNGVGLPAGLDWRQTRSLGLRLVQMLAGQLDAKVEKSGNSGTEFEVTFSNPPPAGE